MIKSRRDNLFSHIFPNEKECASLIIKFLLVLETEKLIPLFDFSEKDDSSLAQYSTTQLQATVTNCQGEMLSVKEIMQHCHETSNFLPLFFGSNFQLNFSQQLPWKKVYKFDFNTFLIFSQEGLILENQAQFLELFLPKNNIYYQQYSDDYCFIPWDYWQDVQLIFADNKPECSLKLTKGINDYLMINIEPNFNSEAEQIECQLPLIFCYFILKQLWRYVEQFRYQSYIVFDNNDFLYLGGDRLSYFINNVLKKIEIKEDDLEILIKSC